jgi:hypothetical protein
MPGNERGPSRRQLPVNDVQIRATDTARIHLYKKLDPSQGLGRLTRVPFEGPGEVP